MALIVLGACTEQESKGVKAAKSTINAMNNAADLDEQMEILKRSLDRYGAELNGDDARDYMNTLHEYGVY